MLVNRMKNTKTPTVLAIREGKIQKDKKKPRGAKGKGKGKNKLSYAPKPMIPLPPKRDNPAKDSVCHHCKEVGHWRRNCPSYQAKLKKRKNASMASTSAIFTIELYAFPNKTWVYDTGCGTHIPGLRGKKSLNMGFGTDTPYLLDGYGVLVFRIVIFKISSFKLQNALLLLCFTNYP
ncbi:zinc finger, CCHC-type containing protein [Tanacetum coccineum]